MMKTWDVPWHDVDEAVEGILGYFVKNPRDTRVIYFDGWRGFGASTVLRVVADALTSMRASPELHLDKVIHIDCSAWKSRRAMQRAIAVELKLGHSAMAVFDKEDEEDNFNGVDEGSRGEIVSAAEMIHQALKYHRFMMIFHNGSGQDIDVNTFGVPTFGMLGGNLTLWTFRRRFRARELYPEMLNKVKNAHLFAYESECEIDRQELFFPVLQREAAAIAANYPCMRETNPERIVRCCLYELFLHLSFPKNIEYDWASRASSYWICDGITQGDRAWEIVNALREEIKWELSPSLLDEVRRRFIKEFWSENNSSRFLSFEDKYIDEQQPYPWVSITSRNLQTQDMQAINAEATSYFLAPESPSAPLVLADGLFKQPTNLHVLHLSCCAFSFASPPFICCQNLRFLGLDQCKDNNTREGEGHAEWARLNSLWVLDLRYTDWDEILSEEKMDLMTNLWELNIEGVRCWQYTSQLQGRVPCLHRLRVIKPTCGPEKSKDTSNSFLDKAKLEILDLSGNREMDILPNSLSKASSLQVLVLDGCNGLQDVVVPDGLPHLLRSFSFDGYGPASHSTPTIELPPINFRPSTADNKDVKTSMISLEGCTQLENVFLRGLPNLVELDLSGTAIKILDFETMVVEVPRIKRLFLLGCERLRAIIWGNSGSQIQPDLELLCIDTRPGIERPRPSSNQNKSFLLQVHAIIVDARLARSLWSPIQYHRDTNSIGDAYFNIRITSSPVYSGVVQLEATCKGKIGPGDTEVFTKVLDVPMQAFPQPPTPQSDRHIEIAQGSRSVESELDADSPHRNLGHLIKWRAESLRVHDVSTSASMPEGDWEYLRQCHVERCPKLDTIFPSRSYNFVPLATLWASDLLMARCIWSKGSYGSRSFENLQHLHLRSCPMLQFVLPVRVSSFPSLQTLHIIHCGDLRHVFVLDKEWSAEEIAFPKLTTIHLYDLPTLRQICEVKMVAPALETIRIRGCWGLRRLPVVAARGQDEKKPTVEIEKDVWDALEWDGVDAGHHPDLFEVPIHSRYYKKKLPRVSVLSIRYGLMVALTLAAKLATCLKQ